LVQADTESAAGCSADILELDAVRKGSWELSLVHFS